jgi:hypothetical protein
MQTIEKRYTTRLDLRPRGMSEEWRIFNAPRPIYGSETWEADFLSGIFYAAIVPGCEREEWMLEENRRLAAVEVIFVPEEVAYKAQQERILARYGEEARWYVEGARYKDELVQQYLDNLHDGTVELPVEVVW